MSKQFKIGIIREGKVPPDKRVPLTPDQCVEVMQKFPGVQVIVEPSVKRCFSDRDYTSKGIELSYRMEDCDILMGIKEVPVPELTSDKTYFFFSHTIKKQPHNRKLLKRMLELNITMIDYETLTDTKGNRLIAFGRYAGIVGCYNGFRAYGEKFGVFKLKPAHQCLDQCEMEKELEKIKLPSHFKVIVTGRGRVGGGCSEILHKMNMKEVSSKEFLTETFNQPVFAVLNTGDYYHPIAGGEFNRVDFHKDPSKYSSAFLKYACKADMYIPCHFWDKRAPKILKREDYLDKNFRIKVVADVSCDIAEPIASTIRASTIADPFYGYDPLTGLEADFYSPKTIGVMAVDNLPCELPRNASEDFGRVLIDSIFPCLFGNDPDHVIERATICSRGELMSRFSYLADYVE
ncbi:MAG: NAD(P)-dependent oxidoreductase [Bacteroidota bacterium]